MTGDPHRLAATLQAAGAALGDLVGTHQAAADVVLAKAVPATPRRTGRLAATVRSDVVTTGYQITADTRYAAAVHARRPWIAQAIAATEADQIAVYATHVQNVVATIES